MGLGNVAPAPLINVWAVPGGVDKARVATARPWTRKYFSVWDFIALSPFDNLLLRRRRCARQRVTQVEHQHVEMRVVGLSHRDEPGIAGQPGVLTHQIDGAILRIFPERLIEAESDFLNRTVVAVRRTSEPVAGRAVGLR